MRGETPKLPQEPGWGGGGRGGKATCLSEENRDTRTSSRGVTAMKNFQYIRKGILSSSLESPQMLRLQFPSAVCCCVNISALPFLRDCHIL
jgi:hypothetical protein